MAQHSPSALGRGRATRAHLAHTQGSKGPVRLLGRLARDETPPGRGDDNGDRQREGRGPGLSSRPRETWATRGAAGPQRTRTQPPLPGSYSRLLIFPNRSLLGRPRCMSSRAVRGPMASGRGPRWPPRSPGVRRSPGCPPSGAPVRRCRAQEVAPRKSRDSDHRKEAEPRPSAGADYNSQRAPRRACALFARTARWRLQRPLWSCSSAAARASGPV